jgi:hypothetical protein
MFMKSAMFGIFALACIVTFVPAAMAESILGPNVLVFTEQSITHMNVAWSGGTPVALATSPIMVESTSPNHWSIGLATFLLRTTNTTCPGIANCVVPLGWIEPDDDSLFNIITYTAGPCTVLGRLLETCFEVVSDASYSDFRFTPLADGETFASAARSDSSSDSAQYGFAFVEQDENAVPEPRSFGLIAIGLAGIVFQLRKAGKSTSC